MTYLHIFYFSVTAFYEKGGGGCVREWFTDDLIENHH